MKRREFITLIGGAAVGWPLAALAEPRLPLGRLQRQTFKGTGPSRAWVKDS